MVSQAWGRPHQRRRLLQTILVSTAPPHHHTHRLPWHMPSRMVCLCRQHRVLATRAARLPRHVSCVTAARTSLACCTPCPASCPLEFVLRPGRQPPRTQGEQVWGTVLVAVLVPLQHTRHLLRRQCQPQPPLRFHRHLPSATKLAKQPGWRAGLGNDTRTSTSGLPSRQHTIPSWTCLRHRATAPGAVAVVPAWMQARIALRPLRWATNVSRVALGR